MGTVIAQENVGLVPCRVFLTGKYEADPKEREHRLVFVPIDTDKPLKDQL